jgi:hypothetical protein
MFTCVIAVCERGKAVAAVVALLDQMKILELKVDARILTASLHCCMCVAPSSSSLCIATLMPLQLLGAGGATALAADRRRGAAACA